MSGVELLRHADWYDEDANAGLRACYQFTSAAAGPPSFDSTVDSPASLRVTGCYPNWMCLKLNFNFNYQSFCSFVNSAVSRHVLIIS